MLHNLTIKNGLPSLNASRQLVKKFIHMLSLREKTSSPIESQLHLQKVGCLQSTTRVGQTIYMPWHGSIILTNRPSFSFQHLMSICLLRYDGHNSHILAEFVGYCLQSLIKLILLPPHSSHLLQPLDVGVFSPLKKALAVRQSRLFLSRRSLARAAATQISLDSVLQAKENLRAV